jgi:tripartite-type tricarboxylate transporter receptor subunit TctC
MRNFLYRAAVVAGALFTLVAPAAQAQPFPNKPDRISVPAAAGGPTDTIARILGKVISEQHGVAVVIDNRAGAGGVIGAQAVVQAPADGYTLLVSVPDAVTLYPLVKKSARYAARDLIPITLVASTPYVFGANPQVPAKSMQEFVALSKTRKLAMATPGPGTSVHIVLELLQKRSGIELLHVPYKGAAPALQSVVAGETQISVSSPVTLKGYVDGGKMTALAVTGAKRNPVLPNVPTMVESGFPNFVVSAWFGVFAPAGTPDSIADKLNEMMVAAMHSPEYTQRMAALGLDIEPVSRAAFAQMLESESSRWKQLVEAAKITSED